MTERGSLILTLRTVLSTALDDMVQVGITPVSSSTGGQPLRTPEFPLDSAVECELTGIACTGVGTEYVFEVRTRRYQTSKFIQRIQPGRQRARELPLLVNPGKVKGIRAPAFEALEGHLQTVLQRSEVPAFLAPANPPRFLQGPALYDALPALKKACLLNVARKAADRAAGSVWQHVQGLRRLEQDRVFVLVADDLRHVLAESGRFFRARNTLHAPMPGFALRESFKSSDDEHANLQVTLMESANGQWAADLDIDESAGFPHHFEVLRNSLTGRLTNPYQVRELLILYQGPERNLHPGYEFVF